MSVAASISSVSLGAGPDGGRWVLLLQLAAAGLTSAVTFVAASRALRVTEPFEMYRWALEKIRSRSSGEPTGEA